MTLSELIVQLQGLEVDCGDHVVLMASDPEGNSFSAVGTSFWSVGFAEKDGYSYEFHEQEDDEDPEDPPSGDPCVCIWP